MKTVWHNLLALLAVAMSANAFERIEVDARLDVDSHRVHGVLRSNLVGVPNSDSSLHLRLYPNRGCERLPDSEASGDCGIALDSLLINGREYIGSAKLGRASVSVSLLPADRKDSVSLRVVFRVDIPEGGDRFGRDTDRIRLECWMPVPSPRSREGWIIEDYASAHAEPAGDLFNYRVSLTLPDSLQVISPGIAGVTHSDNRNSVQIALDSALDVPLFIASGYSQDTAVVAGVTRRVYSRTADREVIDSVAAWIDYTMEYMSREVMAYPFDEFVGVIDAFDFSGALELPRMIWMPSLRDGIVTGWPRAMVIHEVVHQWFYGVVISNQARHPWLDESVTQYFTMIINEQYGGDRGDLIDLFGFQADYRTALRFQSHAVFDFAPIDLPAEGYDDNTYFGAVYWKGSQVLATLIGLMGSENEKRFWREYARKHAFSRPEPEDFLAAATAYLEYDEPGLARRVIGMTVQPDFVVRSVVSRRSEPVQSDTAGAAQPMFESDITYAVHHPLTLTVPMRLTFDDGVMLDTMVDGGRGIHTLTIERPNRVWLAAIDPDTIFVVDRNLMNNSLSVGRLSYSGLRLWSGLTYLVESMYSILWGW